MAEVRWTPQALGDLEAICLFIARDAPPVAAVFGQRAFDATDRFALFQSQGYAETTIDQIAAAAGVARRTVFGHFPTKEAILFDELAARRNVTIARLHERPRSEPPLVSLHAVMRQMCEQGYDRPLLTQIRNVLAAEPKLARSPCFIRENP